MCVMCLCSVTMKAMGVQDNLLTAKLKTEAPEGLCLSHFTYLTKLFSILLQKLFSFAAIFKHQDE